MTPLPSPFVHQYSTVEEAVATRTALHGVKWPQSNPKFLCADYAEQDEVRNVGRGKREGERHGRLSSPEIPSPSSISQYLGSLVGAMSSPP